jgi:MinD superfamily P-loop ATPase
MKELVVISGKGGTGKTSITACFGYLAGSSVVMADCDVDAADLHLLLQPDFSGENDFYSGEVAIIDQEKCNACGICMDECRFRAIYPSKGEFEVDPIKCEGCGYCARICPEKAIRNKEVLSGKYYISDTRIGTAMVHARLSIGASNSGKLVSVVKEEAREKAQQLDLDMILVDGSPGTGCPVISSLSGASYVVLVTEPSISGFHDLRRIIELIGRFQLPAGCIINKSDLNPGIREELKNFLREEGIDILGEIPYDNAFSEAMTRAMTVVEHSDGDVSDRIRSSWSKIMNRINLNTRI